MENEQRKFPRIDHVFKIKYAPGNDQKINTHARDISYGGVAFETEGFLENGTEIDLKIFLEELPGDIPARATVLRSWSEEGKYFSAVMFTEIDEEDQTIIEEYLYYFEEGIIKG